MAGRPRFMDSEEEAAVKRLMDKLDASHPVRAAFDQGVEVLQLIMLARDYDDIKHRLRDIRVEALNRQLERE
jgi:hypothetical protein